MQLRATRLTAISHAARRAVAPAAFSPASLFAAGEQGIWLDPSDFSTMFQDAAGVTPVTAVEQPVGRILDKSGRGNHATQPTATSRPILRQDAGGRYYLFFDGIDDSLVTGIITPGTDKVQVFAGVRNLRNGNNQIVLEAGTGDGNFALWAPLPFDNFSYAFASRGSANAAAGAPLGAYVAPITSVLTGIGDISGDRATLRVNAAQVAQSTADQGAGNYLPYPHNIGRRNNVSLPFSGHLYQLTARFGPNLTADQITQAETFFNGKTGAY